MAVTSIGAAPATSASQLVAPVTQQDFLSILVKQLAYQDPLKPIDNEQFISQLAQFTNLAETSQISDKVDSLLNFQSADQTLGLINHSVQAVTASGNSVVGTVTAVTFTNGTTTITVTDSSGNVYVGLDPTKITTVR